MRCAYLDTSVILRALLREDLPLLDLRQYDRLYSSDFAELECRRVLDRIRIQEAIPDRELAQRYVELQERLKALWRVGFSKAIFKRACESFPVVVRTLDSIHLSSFLLVQATFGKEADVQWTFASHDVKLKIAAQSLGFGAVG